MVGVEAHAHDLYLLIPADSEHLRAARLVAADAAGRAGFDCDETDDLRIAVDELCHCLMRVTDGPISLTFAVGGGGVTIEGRALAASALTTPLLHPFSETILRSATDFFEVLDTDHPEVGFVLGKTGARAWA
ncbi:MAG: ATP-binding protein [Acidimicrobiia bacterium]